MARCPWICKSDLDDIATRSPRSCFLVTIIAVCTSGLNGKLKNRFAQCADTETPGKVLLKDALRARDILTNQVSPFETDPTVKALHMVSWLNQDNLVIGPLADKTCIELSRTFFGKERQNFWKRFHSGTKARVTKLHCFPSVLCVH